MILDRLLLADKPQKAAQTQMGEIAVGSDSSMKGFPTQVYSPDTLISNKKFEVFKNMMTDEEISSSIEDLKILALSTGWNISPADESSELHVTQARFLEQVFANVDGSFHEDIKQTLGALEMGWSLGELVYAPITLGEFAGKICIHAIKSKDPEDFNLPTDAFDNILSVVNIGNSKRGEVLDKNKFVIYSYNKQYEDKFGTSKIRRLYQLWFTKQVFNKAWAIYLEKFGHGIGTFKNVNTADDNTVARLKTILKQLRYETGVIIPSGLEFEIQEATGRGADLHKVAIEYINNQIRKVIQGQTLTTDTGGVGSQALGRVHQDKLTAYLEEIRNDVLDKAIKPQIIKRLIDMNWPEEQTDGKYPQFKWNPIVDDSAEFKSNVALYFEGISKGVIKPQPEDEVFIRQSLKFPKVNEEREDDEREERNEQNEDNEDRNGIPASDLERVMAHYKVDETEAKEMLKSRSADELLPPRGAGRQPGMKFAEGVFTGVRRRTFTMFEDNVDFKGIKNTFDDTASRYTLEATTILQRSLDELLKDVASKKIITEQNVNAVAALRIKYLPELKRVFRNAMTDTLTNGYKDARREIIARKKRTRLSEGLRFQYTVDTLPVDLTVVTDVMEQEAFRMAGVTQDELLSSVKKAILEGVKQGKPVGQIVKDIETRFTWYAAGGEPDLVDITGSRLETTVRTNVNSAYNQGRRQWFESEELDNYVVGYQYSAILDDRVTDICAHLDGMKWRVTNVGTINKLTPPNHYNCRSLLVPITKDDEWDYEEDPSFSQMPKWLVQDVEKFKGS